MRSYDFQNTPWSEIETDLLVLFTSTRMELDAIGSRSIDLLIQEGFTGEARQTALFRAPAEIKAETLLLVGVGDPSQAHTLTRDLSAIGSKQANALRASEVAIGWTSPLVGCFDVEHIVEGFEFGAYVYNKHRTEPEDKPFHQISKLTILTPDNDGVTQPLRRARAIASGVRVARNLVNDPPQLLYPESMAERARAIAERHDLTIQVKDDADLTAEGFNLIMAVGKGSAQKPRLIHLTYRADDVNTTSPVIAFVGKGITFDTGGNNIKTGNYMLTMHCDMAGGAAVLGAAEAIGQLKPNGVTVHFLVPAAENSVSGNAMRPNDIYRGYGDKTVEIHNTDAEGRLVLADALSYAQKNLAADTIIDLATLTGASVVALGEHTSALFTDDEAFHTELQGAISASGEDFWRMPLHKKLDAQLDTPFADMKNVGKRYGGAITAALFLKRWINIERWAHLDIAGPAYTEGPGDTHAAGGTGFGVSTLVHYVLQQAQ